MSTKMDAAAAGVCEFCGDLLRDTPHGTLECRADCSTPRVDAAYAAGFQEAFDGQSSTTVYTDRAVKAAYAEGQTAGAAASTARASSEPTQRQKGNSDA